MAGQTCPRNRESHCGCDSASIGCVSSIRSVSRLLSRWPGRCWRSACEIGQGYGPGTSGLRTFVDEAEKREFSLGIVVNILRHMDVESQQVSVNSGFPAAARRSLW